MKKRARPASTLDRIADQQIADIVSAESEVALLMGNTPAPSLSPMEAALLDLSQDIRNLLDLAGHLKRQGETLESFARLLQVDMERVKAAMRGHD